MYLACSSVSTSLWSTLASSSSANWVPSRCPRLPLPEWYTAPPYLTDGLQRVADISSCSRLRSASTVLLQVLQSKQSTIIDQALPVTAGKVWNNLPPLKTSSPASVPKNAEVGTVPMIIWWRTSLNITANVTAACSLTGRRFASHWNLFMMMLRDDKAGNKQWKQQTIPDLFVLIRSNSLTRVITC